jgi:cardiolipin synthase
MIHHQVDEETNRSRDRIHHVPRSLESLVGVPATDGNRVTILRNGDEIFPSMLEAIGGARTTIDLLNFVYWKGEIGRQFAEGLAERARAGVRVRVLLDAWGSRPIERSLLDLMDDAGVQVRWFRPLRRFRPRSVNHRTHRKLLVIDECTAFTGGVGISDLWLGDAQNDQQWRDTHFKVEGPAVDGIRAVFIDNWSETEATIFDPRFDHFPDQPTPGNSTIQCVRGDSATGGSELNALFKSLLQLAEHRFRITTAYFVPDEELLERLCEAATRGVHVQILLPGPHADKRFVQVEAEADYTRLIEAGVELWNFQVSMLHAKIMTIDGLVANVGSANFNFRSLRCDDEFNFVAFDPEIIATLDAHFDDDLERSTKIDPQQWRHRALLQRVFEVVTKALKKIS